MANEYILKDYKGSSIETTLSNAYSIANTSLTVSSGSTFPDGSSGPFVVVISRGLADEEKMLISSRTSNTLTILEKGYDGTTSQNHVNGSSVNHCLDAYTLVQANRYVNLQATKGSLVTRTASTTVTLPAGTNGYTLVADSTATNGIVWQQIATAGIGAQAVTDTQVSTTAAIALSKLATGALPTGITVASANIVDGTIVNADISGSATIALSKLDTGALPTGITVASANIVNGTIVDADINSSANITASKLLGVQLSQSGNNNKTTFSTATPSGSSTDGDIWFVYV
jgi:hypothetical protein